MPESPRDPERHIARTWSGNADAWVRAVRGGFIQSRVRATNDAIVAAILEAAPRSVLDVGCGEGWLVRALAANDVNAVGIDMTAELIEAARAAGLGEYHELAYDDLPGDLGRFDALVCNFSLLGRDSVRSVFEAAPALLNIGGRLIVQTVHESAVEATGREADGWQAGSWTGCGEGFRDPAPWYYRVPATWSALFERAGMAADRRVVLDPETGQALSVLYIGEWENRDET